MTRQLCLHVVKILPLQQYKSSKCSSGNTFQQQPHLPLARLQQLDAHDCLPKRLLLVGTEAARLKHLNGHAALRKSKLECKQAVFADHVEGIWDAKRRQAACDVLHAQQFTMDLIQWGYLATLNASMATQRSGMNSKLECKQAAFRPHDEGLLNT